MIDSISCVTTFEKLKGPIKSTAGGEVVDAFCTYMFLFSAWSASRLDYSGQKLGAKHKCSLAFIIIGEQQALDIMHRTHAGIYLGQTVVTYLSILGDESGVHCQWYFYSSTVILCVPIDSNVLKEMEAARINYFLTHGGKSGAIASLTEYINRLILSSSIGDEIDGSSVTTAGDRMVGGVVARQYVVLVQFLGMKYLVNPTSVKGDIKGPAVSEFPSIVIRN